MDPATIEALPHHYRYGKVRSVHLIAGGPSIQATVQIDYVHGASERIPVADYITVADLKPWLISHLHLSVLDGPEYRPAHNVVMDESFVGRRPFLGRFTRPFTFVSGISSISSISDVVSLDGETDNFNRADHVELGPEWKVELGPEWKEVVKPYRPRVGGGKRRRRKK